VSALSMIRRISKLTDNAVEQARLERRPGALG
jgi:hypothetical protein